MYIFQVYSLSNFDESNLRDFQKLVGELTNCLPVNFCRSRGQQRRGIKKQATSLPNTPVIANNNSIVKVTLVFAGFVQHRFHCSPVGRNETLVIGGRFVVLSFFKMNSFLILLSEFFFPFLVCREGAVLALSLARRDAVPRRPIPAGSDGFWN